MEVNCVALRSVNHRLYPIDGFLFVVEVPVFSEQFENAADVHYRHAEFPRIAIVGGNRISVALDLFNRDIFNRQLFAKRNADIAFSKGRYRVAAPILLACGNRDSQLPKAEAYGLARSVSITHDWRVDNACHSSPCGRKRVFCPVGVFNRFLLTECLADCFGQSLAEIISLLRTEVNAEKTKKKGEARFLPTLKGLGLLAQFL